MRPQDKARHLRPFIEKAATSLDDADATKAVELFKHWAVGVWVERGERLEYKGKLYRVEQDHTTQADYTPDTTPALYTRIAFPGEILPWKRPTGAQDAYQNGDKVYYPDVGDPIYQSNHDYNVYSPEEYPDWWDKISD